MFKKTLKYTDFNGDEQERDFYFHLGQAEVAAMAHGADELRKRMERIEKAKDGFAILEEFRAIIKMGCGKRSEDGQRFIKTPEAQSELLDSPAFDVLLMELSTSANGALDFIGQLFPSEVMEEMKKQLKDGEVDPFKNVPNPKPAYQIEGRNPTSSELQRMSKEEMQAAFRWRAALDQ